MGSYAFQNRRVPRRLLRHCALLGRALRCRVPARRRLEAAIGREQARLLVAALAGDQGLVRRARRRAKS